MRVQHWQRMMLPCFALLLALVAPGAAWAEIGQPTPQGEQPIENGRSYGYVRTVEGHATLLHSQAPATKDLTVNQPLMVGDEVIVDPGSRIEVVLPDHNVARLAGGSDLRLEHLAFSADSTDRTTLLRLVAGELQLQVSSQSLGDQLPRIDTANATVYVQQPGSYRIGIPGKDQTEVMVRDGYAEVLTPDGSAIVRDEEEAWVEGATNVRVALRQAGALDRLESWGNELDQEAQAVASPYVNPSLSYESSSLAGAGSWVSVSGRYAWRPYVAAGWRPYEDGRWDYTPSGWSWVAAQPWGWITGHYGSWDYAPEYGWLWYPGDVYSPAWVYWYWGPQYVGWCPIGVYANYYSPMMDWDEGVFWVLYGGVRAPWDYIQAGGYWTFSRCGELEWRHYRYWNSAQMRRRYLGRAVPRGVVTTNSRAVLPRDLARPGGALRAISTRPHGRAGAGSGNAAPDLTAFIARKPQLPMDVQRALRSRRTALGLGTGGSGERAIRTVDSAPGRRHGAPIIEPRVPNPRVPDHGVPAAPSAWRSRVAAEPGVAAPIVRPNDWRTVGRTAPSARPSTTSGNRAVVPRGTAPTTRATGNSWRSLGSRAPLQVRPSSGVTNSRNVRRSPVATQSWRMGRPGVTTTAPSVQAERRTINPRNLQGWHSEGSYILHGPTVSTGVRPPLRAPSSVQPPRIPVVRRVIEGVRGLSRTMSAPYRTPPSAYGRGSSSPSAPRGSYRAPSSRGGSGGGRSMSRPPSHSGGAARTRSHSGGSHGN